MNRCFEHKHFPTKDFLTLCRRIRICRRLTLSSWLSKANRCLRRVEVKFEAVNVVMSKTILFDLTCGMEFDVDDMQLRFCIVKCSLSRHKPCLHTVKLGYNEQILIVP